MLKLTRIGCSTEHVSPALALPENWQRGITPKIMMPELWILRMTLDMLKLYPHISFISIASVELELFGK